MRILVYTDEFNVHRQQEDITRLLKRDVDFFVTLKNRSRRSNIELDVSEEEARVIEQALRIEVYVKGENGVWGVLK